MTALFRPPSSALSVLALAPFLLAAAGPGGIAGRWKVEDGSAVVTFAPCASNAAAFCGRVSEFLVAEPKGGFRDARNPDPKLRGRPVLGKTVFTGLVPAGRSWKGKGYSVKDGRHFTATLTVERDRLTLRGCVAIICRTVVWTRA